jgi:predicted PurR-regulated permease PerM
MQEKETVNRTPLPKDLTDTIIRIGLIAVLAVMCVRLFAPFANLMLWALILAIALYPMHQSLARRLGGRQGGAATLVVVAGLLLIGGPMVMLGGSFASQVKNAHTAFENNAITIEQPAPTVADWPVVGERVYAAWSLAADNLPEFLKENQAELKKLSKGALSAAVNTAGSVLLFLGSLIVAGIMMAFGEAGAKSMQRIFTRVAGPARGLRLQSLSTATVRSVATGVIGVAFIQSLLLGIGFIMAGIPAPGVLALIVMLLGIAQVPAALVGIPAIAYLWWSGDASTTSNIFFSVYLLLAGLADNVLKPLLLGRGVDAPMLIILIGALGGMLTSGIIGLFAGAVLLTVGYKIFMEWLDNADEGGVSADLEQAEPSEQALPANQ